MYKVKGESCQRLFPKPNDDDDTVVLRMILKRKDSVEEASDKRSTIHFGVERHDSNLRQSISEWKLLKCLPTKRNTSNAVHTRKRLDETTATTESKSLQKYEEPSRHESLNDSITNVHESPANSTTCFPSHSIASLGSQDSPLEEANSKALVSHGDSTSNTDDSFDDQNLASVESPVFESAGKFIFRNIFESEQYSKLPMVKGISKSYQDKELKLKLKRERIICERNAKQTKDPDCFDKFKDCRNSTATDNLQAAAIDNLQADRKELNIAGSTRDSTETDLTSSRNYSSDLDFQSPTFRETSPPEAAKKGPKEGLVHGNVKMSPTEISPPQSSMKYHYESAKANTLGSHFRISRQYPQNPFSRSLNEFERSEAKKQGPSFRRKLIRTKSAPKSSEDFMKGAKTKKQSHRSYSDGNKQGGSSWQRQQVEQGSGSAPTSPQTGSLLPKLSFWKKSTSKREKSHTGSETLPEKETAPPSRSDSASSSACSPLREDPCVKGHLQRRNESATNLLNDPTRDQELRKEHSLQIRIQEAKGIPDKKRYYCILLVNGREKYKTTLKYKDGLCFWGEEFEVFQPEEIYKVGMKLIREDKKNMGWGEFQPLSSVQNSKLDEWIKMAYEKPCRDKEEVAIRIRYTFRSITILPLSEYKGFIRYLNQSSISLCKKLEPYFNARTKEDFLTSLVTILQHTDKVTSFVGQLIKADVEQNGGNDKVMFRANSMATKAIEAYMRLVGEKYLENTLRIPIESLLHTCKELEIDPCKLTADSTTSLEDRQKNLKEAVEKTWSHIMRSTKDFPEEIQSIFFVVRENSKDFEMANRLISASVFLRLLCPAIMTPTLFGLAKEYPRPAANRRLTLVAKTLQTLANFSTFQSKEDYMQFLNPFIESEQNNCRHFLVTISGPRHQNSSETDAKAVQKDVYLGRHLALLQVQLKEFLAINCDIKASDSDVRALQSQVNQLEDRLVVQQRFAQQRQTENFAKISSPIPFGILRSSPRSFRNCNSNTPESGKSQNGDYTKENEGKPTRPFHRYADNYSLASTDIFSNSRIPASDLSTSDNYVLQSALINHRQVGNHNNGIGNNNFTTEDELDFKRRLLSTASNYYESLKQPLTTFNDSESSPIISSNHRPVVKSHSTRVTNQSYSPNPTTKQTPLDFDANYTHRVVRNNETNIRGSHSNLSQGSAKTSSGYHSLSYSPSSSPVDPLLTVNAYLAPNNNVHQVSALRNRITSSLYGSPNNLKGRVWSHDSRGGTPVKDYSYHPSPPQLRATPRHYSGNCNSCSPQQHGSFRRRFASRRRSPTSSSSSSSPTSPTFRDVESPFNLTPRTNPHSSPCRISHNSSTSWKNSPARRKTTGSQMDYIHRYSEDHHRDTLAAWNRGLLTEDHMQAILHRLVTMEEEMKQEQDLLLQEMSAKDRLLAKQERHIAALDTANSQLIQKIATLTASKKSKEENSINSSKSDNSGSGDMSVDSSTTSDVSDGKNSIC